MQKRLMPLGPLTSYTTVCPRVVVRLVQLNFRHNPEAYKYKPQGVLNLAEALRRDKFPELYPWLVSLAKGIQQGMSMSEWCDHVTEVRYDALRSVAKRPFRAQGRSRR